MPKTALRHEAAKSVGLVHGHASHHLHTGHQELYGVLRGQLLQSMGLLLAFLFMGLPATRLARLAAVEYLTRYSTSA